MKTAITALLCLMLFVTLGSCAKRPGSAGTSRSAVAAAAGAAAPRPVRSFPVPLACSDRRPSPAAEGLAGAVVRAATAEWRKWGERVVELQPGRSVLMLSGSLPTVWEQEPDAFPMLANYWCAAPPYRNFWETAARHAGFDQVRAPNGAIDRYALENLPVGSAPFADPWSAAFVSYVVFLGGVPDQRFRYSDTHWDYVADAITAAPGTRAFSAAGVRDTAARPGDLLCATRSGTPPYDWRALPAGGSRPMHCDIVVGAAPCAFSPSRRCVEAIGGNVLQGVTLSRIPTDALGHVLPGGEGRDWIVILRNMGH